MCRHSALYIFCIAIFGAALSLSNPSRVSAQISVSVPDTVLGDIRPESVALSVSGELPEAANVRLRFAFDASRIHIKNVTGGIGKIIGCSIPAFSEMSGEINGIFEIQCDSVSAGTGKLFDMTVEILAGSDSIAHIIPDSVFINGAAHEFQSKKGTISIGDKRVKRIAAEGIEQNAPNPFNLSTNFYYNIEDETPVHFRIYSAIGQLMRDYTPFQQTRGRHRFFINVGPGEFGAGAYYLTMTTNKGAYMSYLLCLK
ncbi:hypothetical protein MASR2M18_19520 [Ignavibacteria bacterium]|nr:T9SS type A sorting domain-containing protein [Bacteroidota bacterium]